MASIRNQVLDILFFALAPVARKEALADLVVVAAGYLSRAAIFPSYFLLSAT